jgi:hypothetical protein
MPTDVAVALIVAGLSLVGTVVSLVWNARLQRQQAERTAERDYEYEARKRVYKELQPLLFQLSDACESAYGRIENLALASRGGWLDLEPEPEENWLRNDRYYRESTIYRLLLPAALIRLCRRKLTLVDLSVEPRLRAQLALARLIYSTWNDGYEIARLAGFGEEYHPERAGYDRTYQHVVIGEVDLAADAITTTGVGQERRPLDLGEFQADYAKEGSAVRKHVSVLERLITDFHPDRRPVLWRLLLCQAHLYRALVKSMVLGEIVEPKDAIDLAEDGPKFQWGKGEEPTAEDGQALSEALAKARGYAQHEFDKLPENKFKAPDARRHWARLVSARRDQART